MYSYKPVKFSTFPAPLQVVLVVRNDALASGDEFKEKQLARTHICMNVMSSGFNDNMQPDM
ncbi:hypothetical protein J6590_000340 [Homalodisca vitripennis]|nr:hypothetical protein J6590_000340 [Homalodisca vitripennis]